MNRAFFRFLARSLLWLLAVTLPLQGFASAMRSCCVDERAAAVTVAVEAMQAPQCHGMADMQMQGQPLHMAMDDGGAGHPGHDCSNHGACTVGATAPPGMPAVHALTLRAPPPALAPDSLFAGHIPSGPERPPRSTRSA
ncbi:hypothetical protein JAB5_36400 [Janthinobacterium sp. HH103]|uniref:hypothetical protein n=1 Tax=unclassified Janthinobacterium TaxID=2610881 RepID=UPI00087547F7|nr:MULTISPECIES: hypothetical protein [unclassified Janthinobacterium]OEZ67434.1 hypothetical protein JAB2_23730 [Janthinobacterium sp. HH100]OEZ72306.1 hypothetical protein JAB5_36400 [Janthinobacterium sp. HH103]OEZ86555.1 hypothetical protein JAB8_33830 [Janthinobacterium sp. HH106]QOU74474.1 hypothetical protein JAB4_039430 [Janthinobacterium sp. HH102]